MNLKNGDSLYMNRFVVFDVETPNRFNNRMSSIGITVVDGGKIVNEYYSLINPETFFDRFNTELTGIDELSVRNAPTFPEAWERIGPVMSEGLLVAHNAVFDLSVLRKCLDFYGIVWRPYVRYICTVRMGKRELPGISHRLDSLCSYYGICLDHHNAASDSLACAGIFLKYIEQGADPAEYIRTYTLCEPDAR